MSAHPRVTVESIVVKDRSATVLTQLLARACDDENVDLAPDVIRRLAHRVAELEDCDLTIRASRAS